MGAEFRELAGIDRLVHEPARLIILALLFPLESADFLYLLRETRLTRGNLSAHLAKLEEAGYVSVEKGFLDKVPHTTYCLTREGRAAYRDYRARLKRAVDSLPE